MSCSLIASKTRKIMPYFEKMQCFNNCMQSFKNYAQNGFADFKKITFEIKFDGFYDQGRDREATKYLLPKRVFLSKALNQIDRQEGLAEVKSLLRDSMNDRTMIARFLSLGPTNSVFTILGLQCTDSWYVAHSEGVSSPTAGIHLY